jgi:hypothetical protein
MNTTAGTNLPSPPGESLRGGEAWVELATLPEQRQAEALAQTLEDEFIDSRIIPIPHQGSEGTGAPESFYSHWFVVLVPRWQLQPARAVLAAFKSTQARLASPPLSLRAAAALATCIVILMALLILIPAQSRSDRSPCEGKLGDTAFRGIISLCPPPESEPR